MNISKTSWHYRIVKFFNLLNDYSPESLCPYFWKVVAVIVFVPPVALIMAFLATTPLHWTLSGDPGALVMAVLVAIVEVGILSVTLAGILQDRFHDERVAGTRPWPAEVVYKEPSLFKLWLRAKHRKVCPLIDFVDPS